MISFSDFFFKLTSEMLLSVSVTREVSDSFETASEIFVSVLYLNGIFIHFCFDSLPLSENSIWLEGIK